MNTIGNGVCFSCNGLDSFGCSHCEGSGLFDWAKGVGTKLSDAIFRKTPTPVISGRATAEPPDSVLYEAARRSYDTVVYEPIPGWNLLLDTPTIKVFRDARLPRLIVAVRGTVPTNFNDLKADFAIASNSLESSQRFKEDTDVFVRLTSAFPPSEYSYFMTGHSLGSAIGLALQRKYPFIRAALYFNGALQPVDVLNQPPRTREFYISRDPLYRTVGRFWRDKEVYEPLYNPNGKDGYMGEIGDAVLAHSLSQFGRLYGSALAHSNNTDKAVSPDLAAAIEHPLSDSDVRLLLGHNTAILTYPRLAEARSIDDALDPNGRLVLLYLTTSMTSGHWTGVFRRNENEIEFFDPYGGAIDSQFDFIPDNIEQALGQTTRHLTRLLRDASESGYKVRHNPYRFQELKRGVNSCGRWVAARLLHPELNIHEFKTLIERSGVSPDVFVTVVTEEMLREKKSSTIHLN